ncbi:AEC family transporter [Mycoplasma procyoni]|uniref:AEC family transporter n=1 Tax=Mycoplasma procyoni TaxID=568784 RepID=UPI00197C6B99|nr:AEC family transporter [Mycoplasma procyoni]MBN3534907.1 AEC family transporter [Mycoplasma procyoni]
MDNLIKTLQNQSLWGAIITSLGVILIGYLLAKFKVLKQEGKGVINQIVLLISLPALAFKGFMKDITVESLKQEGIILGVSLAFYIVLSVIAMVWVKFFSNGFNFKKSKVSNAVLGQSATQSRALVMWMLLIFGSTTFFGLPIINSVYKEAVLSANIWNISYRIFLYSFCFMVMAGLKFNKQNILKSMKTALLNPIVIATFLGLVLWLLQLIPGTRVTVTTTNGKQEVVGWFELAKTLPAIEKIFATLSATASPLIWITIGMTLASVSLMNAVKDKWVWIFTALKLIAIPLLVFFVMWPLYANGLVTKQTASAMVVFAAVPPATVAVAYSMKYKLHETFSAQCSALSTVAAVIMMPIWIIILGAVFV